MTEIAKFLIEKLPQDASKVMGLARDVSALVAVSKYNSPEDIKSLSITLQSHRLLISTFRSW